MDCLEESWASTLNPRGFHGSSLDIGVCSKERPFLKPAKINRSKTEKSHVNIRIVFSREEKHSVLKWYCLSCDSKSCGCSFVSSFLSECLYMQALKVKLKMKEEERARFLEQQTLCNSQVNDFTAALEEMEQLLEM